MPGGTAPAPSGDRGGRATAPGAFIPGGQQAGPERVEAIRLRPSVTNRAPKVPPVPPSPVSHNRAHTDVRDRLRIQIYDPPRVADAASPTSSGRNRGGLRSASSTTPTQSSVVPRRGLCSARSRRYRTHHPQKKGAGAAPHAEIVGSTRRAGTCRARRRRLRVMKIGECPRQHSVRTQGVP